MAVYTIQRDPPWQTPPQASAGFRARGGSQARAPRSSALRSSYTTTTASTYSDDEDPDMAEIKPLRVLKNEQKQNRHSRIPIFNQVRSMLHKSSLTNPAPDDKDVESAKNTLRDVYETTANRASEITKNSRSQSPVSVLHDDDLYPSSPPLLDCPSPVSSVSASSSLHYAREHKMRPLQIHVPSMPKTSAPSFIKRKPAPARHSLPPNSHDSPPPSRDSNAQDFIIKGSHFSWTTGAPSPTSTRPSIDRWPSADRDSFKRPPIDRWPSADRDSFQTPRHCSLPEPDLVPNSRFSWSTAQTSVTHQARPDTPPPSPPPPIPTKYKTPPVRSILSRHRPIQRMDRSREQWAPPRKASLPGVVPSTPSSVKSRVTSPKIEESTGSGKKLPPPPDLAPMTHLEGLQREEQDKIHQRKNVLHAISELSKIQNASPMEVPFSHVRDAKRRLAELQATLSEIQLEEREIGIAISRARRKEGEEEGLWVRRVTG
jgi:hypothetical protein